MATTKPITARQFSELMDNLDSYICTGFSHNVGHSPSIWDTLHFKYDGSPTLGLDFHVSHPLSSDKSRIDYSVIEVRFSAKYPIDQDWAFRISDPNRVERFKKTVAPLLEQYRESLTPGVCREMSLAAS